MQNAPEIKRENINRFLCENCGANMVFDAANGMLTCPYCQHTQEIEASGAVEERDYDSFLREGARIYSRWRLTRCRSAATLAARLSILRRPKLPEIAISAARKSSLSRNPPTLSLRPKAFLPFRITDKQANEAYKTG